MPEHWTVQEWVRRTGYRTVEATAMAPLIKKDLQMALWKLTVPGTALVMEPPMVSWKLTVVGMGLAKGRRKVACSRKGR